MKKIILILFLISFLFSCTNSNNTNDCVKMIKSCIMQGEVENFKFEGKTYSNIVPESCVSLAINRYCQVNFDVEVNDWWYDMQDWAKESEKNKKKLIELSNQLKGQAKDTGFWALMEVAEDFIEDDILEL